jgi:hypothetical protein
VEGWFPWHHLLECLCFLASQPTSSQDWELLTQVLSGSKGIVLVKQGSDIGVIVPVMSACTSTTGCSSLFASRSDDSDTTSSNIPESNVESSEIGADNKEHAERLLGVFDLWQERWIQPEGKSDL